MSYLSSRLSKLLISEWSATLTCLPLELLLELLASDDLAADSVGGTLAAPAGGPWHCSCPAGPSAHMTQSLVPTQLCAAQHSGTAAVHIMMASCGC